MKKELVIHFLFMFAFIALVSIFRNWLALIYWPVWVGAIIGTVLPDIDNIIQRVFLAPEPQASAFKSLPLKDKVKEAVEAMYIPRKDNPDLVFHNVQFQLVFLVFAFLLITSSRSFLGIGLVLAFMLHLVIDEVVDFMERGNIDAWFKDFPVAIDRGGRTWYLVASIITALFFGLFL